MTHSLGADSEVGRLRAVLMHRPGTELRRITPRTKNLLRSHGLPWVARAQQEHDVLADMLRGLGAEVIYFTGLLQDVLEYARARDEAIAAALANRELGDQLARVLRRHLDALVPRDLARALVAGLTQNELRTGRGLVYDLLDPRDFVIEPLPNLVFGKDTSVWVGDQAVIGTLPGSRRREADLAAVIYGHHPRFAGVGKPPYRATRTCLDGGDVVVLGPRALAVGVGTRTRPASVELLANHLIELGVVDSVLAVPIAQRGDDRQLDMLCTVVDHGVVLMVPALAFTLTALTLTVRCGELRVSSPRPFLEAAALALNIDRMTVIETGIDSLSSARGQWDDGGNTLAVGNRRIVCDERNVETNARLAAAGFEVVTVPCGELGGVRGGPRSICVPLFREPVVLPAPGIASPRRVLRPKLPSARREHAALLVPAGYAPPRFSQREELAPLR